MRATQRLGTWGEDQACAFLVRHGYGVVARNFHTTQGEIDIVATKGGDYYFIEVKTRHSGELANDLAITALKKRKMEKAAKGYCFKRAVTEGSLVMAGLIVSVNRLTKLVKFRFAVYC